jgi:hypothetical protein
MDANPNTLPANPLNFARECLHWSYGQWRSKRPLTALLQMGLHYLLTVSALAAIGARATNRLDLDSVPFWTPVACLFTLLFILAPYNVWREDRLRVLSAEEAAKPKFSVHPVIRGWVLCLEVRAESTQPIQQCQGRIKAVFDVLNGEKQQILAPSFLLRWSSGFHSEPTPKHTISPGSAAELDLLVLWPCEGPRCSLRVPSFAGWNKGCSLFTEAPTYFFQIDILADNAPPVPVECFADVRYPVRGRRGNPNPHGQWFDGERPEVDRFGLLSPSGAVVELASQIKAIQPNPALAAVYYEQDKAPYLPPPERTPEGRWVIYDVATGARIERWPIDAKDFLKAGTHTTKPPEM